MKRTSEFDKARFFLALSDRTRLRLLNLLGEGEVCVCFFVELLGEPQPKISQHLAHLRQAGIVASRREGKWIHYRIAMPTEPNAKRVLKEVLAWLKEDKEMQRDSKRLVRICCSPELPVALQRAPRPASLLTA